ncbi:MAG: HigA family addiction module antitoxin [Candidatus Gracilibacteria bacterium]
MHENLSPIHPGEILKEEFLKPLKVTQYRLAKDISVSPRRINEIVHRTRAVSADTALRLARYFGTSPEFWLNIQSRYDLMKETNKLKNRLEIEVKVLQYAVGRGNIEEDGRLRRLPLPASPKGRI